MALDPAVLAQQPEDLARPVRVAPVPLVVPPVAGADELQEEANRRQLAYQAARQAVTERERWASLDQTAHRLQQALASVLELQLRLEVQVQALKARLTLLAPHEPAQASAATTPDAAPAPALLPQPLPVTQVLAQVPALPEPVAPLVPVALQEPSALQGLPPPLPVPEVMQQLALQAHGAALAPAPPSPEADASPGLSV